LPYNTTLNDWDNLIPFDLLWNEYRRITKDNSPIVLFAQQPFTSKLVMSNLKEYRHQWVWNKNNSAGFATAKIRPFAICEDILVFGKNKVNYYPIMTKGIYRNKSGYSASDNYGLQPTKTNGKNDEYYPKNLLNFSNANQNDKIHPTQKPVALLEYLIKTYSNEGDLILDNCSGSGSLAIAAYNTKRNFICIERDKNYYEKSVERLRIAQAQLKLF
jgi:site-specific DNA-methyltransferase (adenine-specific)